MALFKPGFGIAAISGKIGGTVYARNRGGMFARAWADPSNPNTPDQINKWQIWTDSAAAWNALTFEDLELWRGYTDQLIRRNRLGDTFKLTAQQIFTECFTNATLSGRTPLTTPSQFNDRPAITDTGTFTAAANDPTIKNLILEDVAATCPSGDSGRLLLYAAPYLRPSVRNVDNQFRLISTYDLPAQPGDFRDPYITKFGDTAYVGWLAHVKLRLIDGNSMLGSTRVIKDALITEA